MRATNETQETQPLLQETTEYNYYSFSSKFCNYSKTVIAATAIILTIVAIVAYVVIANKSIIMDNDIEYTQYEKHWVQIEAVEVAHRPPGWEYVQLCDDSTKFSIVIAIKQKNIENLDDLLFSVSDPTSTKYGKYYTMDEVNDMFAPDMESIAAVKKWLAYYNLDDTQYASPNGDSIKVTLTCAVANKMLNTKYAHWTNSNTGKRHLRVMEKYYIPQNLQEHIDLLSPTLRFPVQSDIATKYFISSSKKLDKQEIEAKLLTIKQRYKGFKPQDTELINGAMHLDDTLTGVNSDSDITDSGDFSYVTPAVLQKLYSIDDKYLTMADSSTNNIQGISSWLSEYFDDDDLSEFSEEFGIKLNQFERIPSDQEDGYGAEATLDVQYIASTGRDIRTEVFYTDDESGHWILSFLNNLREVESYPYVISMSYGASERGSGEILCKRANTQMGILSLTGITFFASSGDSGAAGTSSALCERVGYQPSFPASCPYVTAVGGTYSGYYPSSVSSNTKEIAWSYSGGGFSTFWKRRSFQNSAVSTYLDTCGSLPDSKLYNAEGRAYPDVSAQSVSYVIRYDSGWYTVSGTSASSPTFAGMIALINDMRMQAGKSALGFLNPALYMLHDSKPKYYFNDVTLGHNIGCAVDSFMGFKAWSGWDPVTGLGTPKFSRLAEGLLTIDD